MTKVTRYTLLQTNNLLLSFQNLTLRLSQVEIHLRRQQALTQTALQMGNLTPQGLAWP